MLVNLPIDPLFGTAIICVPILRRVTIPGALPDGTGGILGTLIALGLGLIVRGLGVIIGKLLQALYTLGRLCLVGARNETLCDIITLLLLQDNL